MPAVSRLMGANASRAGHPGAVMRLTGLLLLYFLAHAAGTAESVWIRPLPNLDIKEWSSCAVTEDGRLGCYDAVDNFSDGTPDEGPIYTLPEELQGPGVALSATILTTWRSPDPNYATRVCVLTSSHQVRCYWVEVPESESQARFTVDITSALLPKSASEGIAAMCSRSNYVCVVTLQGGLSCGSLYLNAPDYMMPVPSWQWTGVNRGYPELYETYSSHFAGNGPFLQAPGVVRVSCGELYICAMLDAANTTGGAATAPTDDGGGVIHADGTITPNASTASSTGVACWGLDFADDNQGAIVSSVMVDDAMHVANAIEQPLPPSLRDLGGEVHEIAVSYNQMCIITRTLSISCAGWEMVNGLPGTSYVDFGPEPFALPSQLGSNVVGMAMYGNLAIVCVMTRNRDVQCYMRDGTPFQLPPSMMVDGYALALEDNWLCALDAAYLLRCYTMPVTPIVQGPYSTGVASVTLGYVWSCIILESGSLACLDYLGTNFIPSSLEDVSVQAVGVGVAHAAALTVHGELKAWNSDRTDYFVPDSMQSGVASVCTGLWHTCAVKAGDGTLSCWQGVDVPDSLQDTSFKQVSCGGFHACAIARDARLLCFGDNRFGQLDVPDDFSQNITAVSAGRSHTCALNATGHMQCWGWNYYGQSSVLNYLQGNIVSVSAGYGTTCAITRGNTMRCFGGPPDDNVEEQVYLDTASSSSANDRTCRVTTSGDLECWTLLYLSPLPKWFSDLGAQPPNSTQDGSNVALKAGLIAGAVGVACCLAALAACMGLSLKRRRQRHKGGREQIGNAQEAAGSHLHNARLVRAPDVDHLLLNKLLLQSDQIKLEQVIGQGSHGAVHLGELRGAAVAVKQVLSAEHVVALQDLRDGRMAPHARALAREIRLMAQVRSQYVVQFLGVCLDPFAMVTEYMAQGSLYSVMTKAQLRQQGMAERLTWRQRLKVALHVALVPPHTLALASLPPGTHPSTWASCITNPAPLAACPRRACCTCTTSASSTGT